MEPNNEKKDFDIKTIRSETDMTQKAFSDKMQIPIRTLQQWEQGAQSPPEYVPRLISLSLKNEQTINNLTLEIHTLKDRLEKQQKRLELYASAFKALSEKNKK